jgi:hypothetical protein
MLTVAVANFGLTWGLAAYMYIVNQNKVTNDRLSNMEDDLIRKYEQHAERLASVEVTLRAQPTHKDVAMLYESINKLAATVNQLVGETKMQSDVMRMMMNTMVGKGLGSAQGGGTRMNALDKKRASSLLATLLFRDGTCNPRDLRDDLERVHGIAATLDRVRADLAWLADVGLVGYRYEIAMLTEEGRDVVCGRRQMP